MEEALYDAARDGDLEKYLELLGETNDPNPKRERDGHTPCILQQQKDTQLFAKQ